MNCVFGCLAAKTKSPDDCQGLEIGNLARPALFNQGDNVRIAVVLMFIAAAALATDADARRRGGSSKKAYRAVSSALSSSSSSRSSSSRYSSYTAPAAGAAAVGAAGLALAADDDYYVSVPTLNVRSDWSTSGKVLKQLKKGDSVHAYEISSGWARISPAGADPEWVIGSSLSRTRP